MATSIASQLQAIKTLVTANTDSDPRKRPFTRPSILFNPKEAADIDLDTILTIALSGLEVLTDTSERFRHYKNDLFSYKSKEVDRELLGIEDNNKINASISSFLRLLSGYLESPSALKTLEYLIRRYKIHVYNVEELILCALPYHDTHIFVRIVQLIDTGNSKWKFLDGVKASGAPPPRRVIVQQCIRDLGVLETLCNYATPTKKSYPSRHVIGFCTAVVVETLGSLTAIDTDVVKRVLPYVVSGLQIGVRGDQRAGALIIISLLAEKVTLSPSLVKSLVRSLAEVVQEEAKESSDLQWFQMSLMALINLVQLQKVEIVPKKTLDILRETRDLPGVLSGLAKEYNIDRFLAVLFDSLFEQSFCDGLFHQMTLSMIERVPLKSLVGHVVAKLLNMCMRISKNKDGSLASESGSKANQILSSMYKKYPSELCAVVNKDAKASKKDGSKYEILSKVFDGNLDSALGTTDSKIWFALEHPKAEIRRSTLSKLDIVGILNNKTVNPQRFDTVRDAILRRLHDDDLSVVHAVLNMERLPDVINPEVLLDALQKALERCSQILVSGETKGASLACDVAVSCLLVMRSFSKQVEFTKKLATIVFPLLLIFSKTLDINLKALELAKGINWPFYKNLLSLPNKDKKLELARISSINVENITGFAQVFSMHPEEYAPWLVECCNTAEASQTLLLLILMQSVTMIHTGGKQLWSFLDVCFPMLKKEWIRVESAGVVPSVEESNIRLLDRNCTEFLGFLNGCNVMEFNADILVCLFWKLVEAFISAEPDDVSSENSGIWGTMLQDLFFFFASQSKHVFRKHLHCLVTRCKTPPSHFLSNLFTEEGVSVAVQVQSLHCFAHLCSQSENNLAFQLLAEFPSILVPMFSDDQDVRMAAMSCIEGLLTMWSRINFSKCKNGTNSLWINSLGDLLGMMVQQKKMILSDTNVLVSFFTSFLNPSSESLLVQQPMGKRFDQPTRDDIMDFVLGSALRLSAYAKLKILSLLKGLGAKVICVAGVKALLYDLLERRLKYHVGHDKNSKRLLNAEVGVLCVLLEICVLSSSTVGGHDYEDAIMNALQLGGAYAEHAVVDPCIAVLRSLNSSVYGSLKTETQELLFRDLIILFRTDNGDIRNAAREALLRINIDCSIVVRMLDSILDRKDYSIGSVNGKKIKKAKTRHTSDLRFDEMQRDGDGLSFIVSLLDVLLLKKNIEKRSALIGSLFRLLHMILSENEWVLGDAEAAAYIKQTLLLSVKEISASLISEVPLEDDIVNDYNLDLLVKCAHSSTDAATRNNVFLLLTTLAELIPEKVVAHILDILVVLGESAVSQWDSYSQRVSEDLVSALVPCWLSKSQDTGKLLQVFVNMLPQISEHRRLLIIVHLLRNLGESESLGSFLFLLFRSLTSRKRLAYPDDGEPSLHGLTSVIGMEWEYLFAKQLCEQYTCMIWLPSIVLLLQQMGNSSWNEALLMELLVAVHFISDKLQDPELAFKFDSGKDSEYTQRTLGALMEQIVSHLQLIDSKRKEIKVPALVRKELKEYMRIVLRNIMKALVPSAYFEVIIHLLGHADKNVRKKALGLLSEAAKESTSVNKHVKRETRSSLRSSWLQLDGPALQSFNKMCTGILKLVDDCSDESSQSLKLTAVSTLEVLATKFNSDASVFSMCLGCVSKNIGSDNHALSSNCLRTTGALVNVLGPKALPELPRIMECILRKSREVPSSSLIAEVASNVKDSVIMSVLVCLEAVINNLGSFLNPYIRNILELIVLQPEYANPLDLKLMSKAVIVRKLIADRIPVRLLLPPLLSIYSEAAKCGDSSLSVIFEMLGSVLATMDRPSVGAFHAKIFDLCLQALDLRRQSISSITNIDLVEKTIIDAMVGLTMKLTETMFKPLFVKTIEWSVSNAEESECSGCKMIDRAISFYGLANKLAESHRSLFVPYFKYLLDSCVRHLTNMDDANVDHTRKKKKAKLQGSSSNVVDMQNALSVGKWHLRALILSSLQKCFLYDTGTLKFLDTSNFQVLLKPIVSQIVADPPASLERHPNVPSVEEVDNLLVACVGQMAVTAGSDLLWKPLNHEVLMQTRSEKVRSRILALRIVKYLVEHLKEEYLVFLAETIPFLGELLEDAELPVKSLAQEILKEMESMSGESLRQYL